LEEISEYLYKQQLSKEFVRDYINRFEIWLESVLGQFPDSGSPMLEYGSHTRRIVYRKYSFVYRITDDEIEILTVYRENQP